MSQRKRGRITVQPQPTRETRVAMRMMGAFHAVFGIVFALIAITAIIPNAGLFGLPFLLAGIFFAANGIRLVVSKNGFAQRVGYDVETDVEEETIVGLLDDVDKEAAKQSTSPAPTDHDHIPSTALNTKSRLEQLETLKGAGLITDQEYKQKRQEILKEL